jgi:predicted RNase H-like nuclease (RuvC/YqgF family)
MLDTLQRPEPTVPASGSASTRLLKHDVEELKRALKNTQEQLRKAKQKHTLLENKTAQNLQKLTSEVTALETQLHEAATTESALQASLDTVKASVLAAQAAHPQGLQNTQTTNRQRWVKPIISLRRESSQWCVPG